MSGKWGKNLRRQSVLMPIEEVTHLIAHNLRLLAVLQ